MGIETLSDIEIIQGTFSLLFVIISMILGLRLISKYFSLKRKELITIGLFWMLLTSAWWSASFSFLSVVLFDYQWLHFEYFLVGLVLLPIAMLCWVYSFTHILYPEWKKRLLIIYGAISAVWLVIILYLLFTGYACVLGGGVSADCFAPIGELEGKFNSGYEIITLSYIIIALFTILISGEVLAIKTMSLDDPKTRWRGRFLAIAFILFFIGAVIDATGLLVDALVGIILIRLVLILSGLLFYMGFLLPERVAKWLVKD